MADKPMTDEQLCGLVSVLVKDAENYREERSADRIRAMEYYDGTMSDLPADAGRSRVVSRDVQASVKKVLPSLVRTILGNDQVVEYVPVGQGDEQSAEQATDYVNLIVLPESDGYSAIEDAIFDALKLRNGIIKWWFEEKTRISVSEHSGLDEAAFAQLVADDSVTVLEHTAREETLDGPDGPAIVPAHDVKVRRAEMTGRPRIAAIPLESFLIHPDAICLDDSLLVGENIRLRRSDLVAMGYDRDVIDGLPEAKADDREQDIEEDTRRRDVFDRQEGELVDRSMQEVEYYELLVRCDYDGDGIAELRRICLAGGLGVRNLLANEEWDEINYADIVAVRRPHEWEGNSIADDTMEIQKIKTVLLRQTLDNLYWQNNLQPVVQEGVIKNPEAVLNPQFGLPIRVREGVDIRGALGQNVVPFIAKESFAMLAYMNEELTDRTGISDASSGMAPDALQNMTAKASAMIEQAGIGQTEMMVRTIAQSLRRVFKGLLKLIVQHQDKPRTVRLRNDWVTFDPRSWDAGMDATVNTGLGAGTRERDMMMMQIILALQEKLLAALGPVNPFVKPDNVYNAVAKQAEAAGLRSVDLYFTKPDPQEVQKLLEAQANKPNPEQVKAQAQMQLEQFKANVQMRTDEKKMQVDASKEKAQMEADLVVKTAELEKDAALAQQQIASQERLKAMDIAWEREKFALEQQAKREEAERDRAFQADQAEKGRQSDIQKTHAASIGKAFEKNDKAEARAQ